MMPLRHYSAAIEADARAFAIDTPFIALSHAAISPPHYWLRRH